MSLANNFCIYNFENWLRDFSNRFQQKVSASEAPLHMLIGEEFREENLQVEEYDGMTDFEREKAVERAKALNHFRKAQAMVAALDKVHPPPRPQRLWFAANHRYPQIKPPGCKKSEEYNLQRLI